MLPHAECGPNDHRKDAPPFTDLGQDLCPLRPGVSLTSFFEMLKDSDQDGKITFEEFAKRYNINLLEDTDRVNAYQVGIH